MKQNNFELTSIEKSVTTSSEPKNIKATIIIHFQPISYMVLSRLILNQATNNTVTHHTTEIFYISYVDSESLEFLFRGKMVKEI